MPDHNAVDEPVDLFVLVERAADPADYLRLLVATAVEDVPGAVSACLTFEQFDRDWTSAYSGDTAAAGDERQQGLDAGPSLTALRDGVVVDVPDMGEETRWGWYPAMASQAGIGSVLCLPLVLGHPVRGVLTCYANRSGAFTDTGLSAARAWASRATAALVIARWIHQNAAQITQLEAGLRSNQLIGQATGLLMAAVNCTSELALGALKTQSSTSNTKLRLIAERLVVTHDEATQNSARPSQQGADAG